MDNRALRMPDERAPVGDTRGVPGVRPTGDELAADGQNGDTLSGRMRSSRAVLRDLEEEIERLERDHNALREQLADLRWKLGKAERENVRLREALSSSSVSFDDYEKAQQEIARLRREVELYRYNWSLDRQEEEQRRSWWQLRRR